DLARAGLSAFAAMAERQGVAEALVTMAAIRAATGARDLAAELYAAATELRATIAARPAPFDDEIPHRFLRGAGEQMRSVPEEARSRIRSLGVEAAVAKALDS
ncbi:MAG: hypothetical protein M3133_11575, partial [Actinomycetota bacterium]|nr:hypothetical protein [Actinomycetota bacterium]